MIYLYLFGTCFHFIYVFMIIGKNLKDAGLYVEFDTKKHPVVQARAGISLVSISNASENLQKKSLIDLVGILMR